MNEKNITKWALAKKIGVNAMAITRWEKGVTTPNMESIIKLCEFFNVSAGYLIGTEN